MKNKSITDCKLNKSGYCTCYLKLCYVVEDCAPKLIVERNMRCVNKLINE